MLLRDYLRENFEAIEIEDFFTESICRECIAMAETGDWKQSNLGSRKIQTTQLDRAWLEELIGRHAPAEIMGWTYVGVHPGTCQFFKYTKDDTFPDHQDGAIELSPTVQSLFTLVVYLNNCAGGATGFPERRQSIAPRVGKAVIFPQNFVHNSARIESGLKYILRAQLLYKNAGQVPY